MERFVWFAVSRCCFGEIDRTSHQLRTILSGEAMELTEQDRKLITLLQADARVSNQELAEGAGMSASACWRRVRALEEAGVIASYRAIVDPARAGLAFSAMVHVALV